MKWSAEWSTPVYHIIKSHPLLIYPAHSRWPIWYFYLKSTSSCLNLLSGYPGQAKNMAGCVNSQFGAKHKLGGGRSFIKCPFYATSLSLAGLLWGAGCPQIGQLQAGKETPAAWLPPINWRGVTWAPQKIGDRNDRERNASLNWRAVSPEL